MLSQIRSLLQDEEVEHQSLLEITIAGGDTMFAFRTSGSKAVDYWQRLRIALAKNSFQSAGKTVQLTPVLLGTEQSFELTMEHLGELEQTTPPSMAEVIADGEKIDLQNWLAERLERFVCPPGQWPAALKVGLVLEPEPLSGPEQPLAICIWDQALDKMVVGQYVYMALLPTANAYSLPLLLNFGGQENCPTPAVHYAMLKRWQELYGATVLAIEPNAIECFVEQPPMTKEQALKIAREHYGYCNAVIDEAEEGEGELAPYAYELLNHQLWSFWWD